MARKEIDYFENLRLQKIREHNNTLKKLNNAYTLAKTLRIEDDLNSLYLICEDYFRYQYRDLHQVLSNSFDTVEYCDLQDAVRNKMSQKVTTFFLLIEKHLEKIENDALIWQIMYDFYIHMKNVNVRFFESEKLEESMIKCKMKFS